MSGLPRAHPSLSLHLADRALTPIITSAPPPPSPPPLLSPPAASFSPSGGGGAIPAPTADGPSPLPRGPSRLQALTSLTAAALSSHDAALRLGLGRPRRVVVECARGGPVVTHSFLDGLDGSGNSSGGGHYLNGGPGQGLAATHPSAQTTPSPSPAFGVSAAAAAASPRPDGVKAAPPAPTGVDASASSSSSAAAAAAPPMLVATVVAPSAAAEDARDARRATARLDRLGREFQARWAGAVAGAGAGADEGPERQ